ncbi:hypothetical protein JCM9279_001342 [Rhodotorula babjevae]
MRPRTTATASRRTKMQLASSFAPDSLSPSLALVDLDLVADPGQLDPPHHVARLAADLHVRQSELARLYASLDALLPLHALALAPTSTSPSILPPPTSSTAAAPPAAPARARPPSVLDLPDVRALAAGSRAHAFLERRAVLGEGSRAQREGEQGEMPRDVEVMLELEEEVRQLEEAIARLDGPPEDEAHAASSVLPVDGSQLGDVLEDSRSAPSPAIDTAQHQAEVVQLESQLNALKTALRQAEMERGTLERLVREVRPVPRASFGAALFFKG